jgi:hypothetical protein
MTLISWVSDGSLQGEPLRVRLLKKGPARKDHIKKEGCYLFVRQDLIQLLIQQGVIIQGKQRKGMSRAVNAGLLLLLSDQKDGEKI